MFMCGRADPAGPRADQCHTLRIACVHWCTAPQVDLKKDESVTEGQKWISEPSAQGCIQYLEKKPDGQLIFGGMVTGEWGEEIKPWKMQRA